ncbi:MAG TPA: universal stress protein [Gemmatimonadaceae bacterium]|nr:universal stress protein [Gemmatimonadaceae bacterium]
MVSLSERSIRFTVIPGDRSRRITSNPLRRGPVVLATDGTSRSGASVVAARLLAARLDVPLEVVSVLEPSPIFAPVPDVLIPSDPVLDDVRLSERETVVTDYVSRFSGGATPPRVHVRIGAISSEISRFAEDVSATIVVMGSAPHRRFRRITSGDRAGRVLHSVPCPVLSVPPTFTGLPRTVVVGVDFGASSVRAAQAALLVVDDGGTIVLTHVMSPLPEPASLSSPTPADPATDVHVLFDRLRETLAPYVPAGVKVETRAITDDATDGILESAGHLDAEMVAVGTHGQRVLARLLLGSVAESILHNAEQPVLAAPPPPSAEALEIERQVTGIATSTQDREWALALDRFTHRNAGRAVMLEVDDPDTGAHVAGHGYALMGVTYEPAAHRVEIMLGDTSQPLRHLTRSVVHPDTITMRATATGGEVLDIAHGRGHTIAAVADVHRPADA